MGIVQFEFSFNTHRKYKWNCGKFGVQMGMLFMIASKYYETLIYKVIKDIHDYFAHLNSTAFFCLIEYLQSEAGMHLGNIF